MERRVREGAGKRKEGGRLLMSEKGRRRNGRSLRLQKGWAECEKLGRAERRVDCRDCSRLPEKKTAGIRGGDFRGNRGNREVETAGKVR